MNILYWLKGFLKGKKVLSEEDIKLIETEVDKVLNIKKENPEEESEERLEKNKKPLDKAFRDLGKEPLNAITYGCKDPSNCGLPKNWYGIIAPICSKCGYTASGFNIKY